MKEHSLEERPATRPGPSGMLYDIDPTMDRPEGWPFAARGPTPKGQRQPRPKWWVCGDVFVTEEELDRDFSPPMFRYWLHILNLSDGTGIFCGGDGAAANVFGFKRQTILAYRKRLIELGLLLPGRFEYQGSPYKIAQWRSPERRRRPLLYLPRSMIYAPDLSAHDLRLLLEHLRHPDWDQTDKALAAACKMSPRQVRYSRKRLRDLDYLAVLKSTDDGNLVHEEPRKGKVGGFSPFMPPPIAENDINWEFKPRLRIVS